MSTKLIKVGNSFNVPQKTYICNTAEERDNLKAYFGDLCLVIEDGITYILNSENEWFVYPTGGGGGGASTEMIAPVYNPESGYDVNELAIYDDKMYRAKANITSPAGDFDDTKWDEVTVASAKADLINGKVPAAQLPSYVDDVIEGYYSNNAFYTTNALTTKITGETGKIYVDLEHNTTYRWSGSNYIKIVDTNKTRLEIADSTNSDYSVYTIKQIEDLWAEGALFSIFGDVVISIDKGGGLLKLITIIEDATSNPVDISLHCYSIDGGKHLSTITIDKGFSTNDYTNEEKIVVNSFPRHTNLDTGKVLAVDELGAWELASAADLHLATDSQILSLDGRVTVLENAPAPESSLEAEEMLEVLAETGLIETPGVEYTDYIEDPNGDYLYDDELGEWRLAGENETGTHRAETYVLIYQDYVEDPNGTYLYDEELGEWRLAGDGETGTHSLGDAYILYY